MQKNTSLKLITFFMITGMFYIKGSQLTLSSPSLLNVNSLTKLGFGFTGAYVVPTITTAAHEIIGHYGVNKFLLKTQGDTIHLNVPFDGNTSNPWVTIGNISIYSSNAWFKDSYVLITDPEYKSHLMRTGCVPSKYAWSAIAGPIAGVVTSLALTHIIKDAPLSILIKYPLLTALSMTTTQNIRQLIPSKNNDGTKLISALFQIPLEDINNLFPVGLIEGWSYYDLVRGAVAERIGAHLLKGSYTARNYLTGS